MFGMGDIYNPRINHPSVLVKMLMHKIIDVIHICIDAEFYGSRNDNDVYTTKIHLYLNHW